MVVPVPKAAWQEEHPASVMLGFAGPLLPCNLLSEANAVDSRLGPDAIQSVPRFPDHNVNSVLFLFRSVQEAEQRKRLGGTGFLAGRPIADSKELTGATLYCTYLISNRHVVFEGSACVAAINSRSGGPPIIWDIDQDQWVAHPGGEDVAAVCVMNHLDHATQIVSFMPEDTFVTPDKIHHYDIGLGDEVLMVGRFVNLQGATENLHALRFGNISAMLTDMQATLPGGKVRVQPSFAVEMRSRTGFSGAPVNVYRMWHSSFKAVPEHATNFDFLLGVNWGYIPDEDGENTWLNGVVPAWKITEVLDTPQLLAAQHRVEEDVRARADAFRLSG